MAKAVKNAIIAAFVVWVTYATLGYAGIITLGEGVMLTAVATAAVSTFVATGIGNMMSKGIDVGKDNFGIKTTIKGAANPRQLVYGETVVGGTLVYVKTSGTDNNSLHMIIALAGHEINAISEVRLNGEALTTTTSTISSTTVHTVTNSDFTNTDNDNSFGSGRLVRFTKHLGASDQAYDQYASAQIGSAWTSAHRLRGIAYIYIQFIYDNEKFGGGIPAISAKVQGKKVYDPRTSTTVFSKNPALCIRDYLMDTTNGLGALSTEINDSSSVSGGFVTAANICDQDVDDVSDNAEDRYTLNGFFNTEGEPAAIIESMLSSCAGKISYANGQFNIFAGAAQTPTLTITDDDVLSPINISTSPDTADLFNGVRAIYVDKANKYQVADMPIHLNSTYLGYDTPSGGQTVNFEKYMELQFPYTQSESTAQRLARIGLKANRQKTTIQLTVSLKFYQLQVGDWVRVTNDRMSWTNKYFEVLALGFEGVGEGDDKFLAVQLFLGETANDVYAFDTDNDYEGAVTTGSDQDTSSTPVSPPTNLALSTRTVHVVLNSVTATWDKAVGATILHTEIGIKKTADADSTYITSMVTATVERKEWFALDANTSYSVRARHRGVNLNYSAYTSVVTITTGSAGSFLSQESDIRNTKANMLTALGGSPSSGEFLDHQLNFNEPPGGGVELDDVFSSGTSLPSVTNDSFFYLSNVNKLYTGISGSWVQVGASSLAGIGYTGAAAGYSAGDFNITALAGYTAAAYANASMTNAQAVAALGFTPYNATNPSSYAADQALPTSTSGNGAPSASAVNGSTYFDLTAKKLYLRIGSTWTETAESLGAIASGDVTGALGFTPYNATNPSNYNNYVLPSGVLTGGSISGQVITFTRGSGGDLVFTNSQYSASDFNIGGMANSPFDTSGNFDTNFSLNSTMAIGTSNAAHKITVGSRLTIDGDNERILITDAT